MTNLFWALVSISATITAGITCTILIYIMGRDGYKGD